MVELLTYDTGPGRTCRKCLGSVLKRQWLPKYKGHEFLIRIPHGPWYGLSDLPERMQLTCGMCGYIWCEKIGEPDE